MHCFPFLHWIKFCSGCFRQAFFHLGNKRMVAGCVRQMVISYSNDCMGIDLGGLSIGRLIVNQNLLAVALKNKFSP